MRSRRTSAALAAVLALLFGTTTPARAVSPAPGGPADATIDLATDEGVRLVSGAWRYSDAKIVEAGFRSPGADLKPSGPPNRTYDISPHAGSAGFDDSAWETIEAARLFSRKSTGKLCFAWYRMNVTIPERVGGFETSGSTAVFEIVVDDYAEVWVDGELPRELGQSGGSLIKGYNAPNRLVLGRDVKPGQKIQIAVFGINGPISDPPSNFIWIRSAKLDFYRLPRAVTPTVVEGSILRLDPALDAIVPKEARIEKLAEGFTFVEGPIWIHDGYLLFSGPNSNVIYKWSPYGTLSIWKERSGYQGADIAEYGQPGSNGLTLDREGRLTLCEHGNHRISRLESDGSLTVLADGFEGKRLNSPNDLVYRSDGSLYFTDPPFGLPKFFEDRRKELPYSGVFRIKDGAVHLLTTDLLGPNGLAFSPDERYFYVDNWDPKKKVVMRYEVQPDGTLANGRVFFDMKEAPEEEALDGLKVDQKGNLYVSGPGGVWILSPSGMHLGTIKGPELPANFAWGDADGRTLYMTARGGLYRIGLMVPGIRP
jgi:gluconolactonase